MDVILIVYNEKAVNIDNRLSEVNNVLPKLKFTSELEENGNINFLVITITKSQSSIETAIYRKPTTTDCIMLHDSCYQTQHKICGIRYLVNRKLGYPVPNNKKTEEKKVIQTTLYNNNYHGNIKKHNNRKRRNNVKKRLMLSIVNKEKKWATVTNVGKEMYHITKLFRKKKVWAWH